MCRFVAYQGVQRSPESLVFHGEHSLYIQSFRPKEMLSGSVNADGYGIVWYQGGRPARLGSPFPIWHDPDLPGLLEGIQGETVVAALRNLSPGIPASETGIPPLVVGRWSFVLNGFIQDFRQRFMQRLHARIPADLYGSLTGVSDTEALALLCISECQVGASPGEALERTADFVARIVGEDGASAQLNMVLTDGQTLAVCRASSSPPPNSLYLREESRGVAPGVIVASEPFDREAHWTPVPPHTLVEVTAGRASVRPLASGHG